ncbi:hypothetical protein [Streptomyces sp. NPDC002692]
MSPGAVSRGVRPARHDGQAFARARRYSTAPARSAPAPTGITAPSGSSLPVWASWAALCGCETDCVPRWIGYAVDGVPGFPG